MRLNWDHWLGSRKDSKSVDHVSWRINERPKNEGILDEAVTLHNAGIRPSSKLPFTSSSNRTCEKEPCLCAMCLPDPIYTRLQFCKNIWELEDCIQFKNTLQEACCLEECTQCVLFQTDTYPKNFRILRRGLWFRVAYKPRSSLTNRIASTLVNKNEAT